MTTTVDGPHPADGFAGEEPEPSGLARDYAHAVDELVGESRAEAAAAGRQFRVIHHLWMLQERAHEECRAALARWVEERARHVGRRRVEPAKRTVLDVAAEIGPALCLPAVTAVRRVEHAIVLAESLPRVLQALEKGEIGERQAQVIVETWLELVGSELRPAAEPRPPVEAVRQLAGELLDRAPGRTAAQLRALARQGRAGLLRGTEEARHREARRHRRVWVEADEDGMARLCALLDAATAHAAHARLGAIARRVHAEEPSVPRLPEQAEDGQDRGDGFAAGQPRTEGQLFADVLADLLLEGEPASMPEHLRKIRGQVTVTVPALALLRCTTLASGDPASGDPASGDPVSGPAVPSTAVDGGDVPGNAVPAGVAPVPAALPEDTGFAQLAGYGPIPLSMAARIAATAPSWTRILTHPVTGTVVEHNRNVYAVPADLRRRLRHRDGTCRFPGCRRRAERCDLDHTVAWADGGTTDAGNLAHLCRAHHLLKHREGPLGSWRVEHQAQEGVLTWTSPAGRVHVTYPREHHHPVLSSVRIFQPLSDEASPPEPPPPRPGRHCPPGLPPAAAAILDPPPF